jgi:WD40 repeat protein
MPWPCLPSGVRLLATGHADSAVRLWGLQPLFPGPFKPMATVLRGHGVAVAQLAHHPAIGLLSAGVDNKVKVWDVDARRCISTFKARGMRCWMHCYVT